MTKKASELSRELAGNAATLDDLNGVMRSLLKAVIETMLHPEIVCNWDEVERPLPSTWTRDLASLQSFKLRRTMAPTLLRMSGGSFLGTARLR